MLIQQIVNSISLGAVFALLALGLSLAYSTSRVVNFAYGELFITGAMLTALLATRFGMPYPVAAIASCTVVGLFGGVFSWHVLGRLGSPIERSVALIVLGFMLRDAILGTFGPDSVSLPDVYPKHSLVLAGASVPFASLIIMLITSLLLASVLILVSRSRLGLEMRASAENPQLAAMSGVATQRVQALAFGISCVLAAAAGAILVPAWNVNSHSGTSVGLKAFTAAMLGGFGHTGGSMIGGAAIGALDTFVAGYVTSTWRDAIVYTVLLATLAILPARLLNRGAPRAA